MNSSFLLPGALGVALCTTATVTPAAGPPANPKIREPAVAGLFYPRNPAALARQVDASIAAEQAVTTAFDPMLAKLIVHGATRAEAIARARKALSETVVLGCETNIAFLDRLLADAVFATGEVHTGTLDARPDLAAEPALDEGLRRRLLAAAALTIRPVRDAADRIPALHAAMGGWRN